MRYFILLLLPILSACEEAKICSHEIPSMCHTEKEWEQISKNNIEALDCLDKYFNSQKKCNEKCRILANKKCKIKVLSEVHFK